MIVKEVKEAQKDKFNQAAVHPLQSWEWGEFRKKAGNEVIRLGAFEGQKLTNSYQLTAHPIPYTNLKVLVCLRSSVPDKATLNAIREVGRRQNALFIKFEPNVAIPAVDAQRAKFNRVKSQLLKNGTVAGKSQFARYSFLVDLTKPEEELFANLNSKTRYNVRLAQKHAVEVSEDNSQEAWSAYWELTEETTKRQHFYAHTKRYHELLWETLKPVGITHLLKATFQGKVLSTWMLFLFHDTLYYPYGAWSGEHKEVMANNLMMWEAMRWGKAHGAKSFDLWGAAGPETPKDDSWWGFTKFKEGYGGELVEFLGSFDLVLNPPLYSLYKVADNFRWKLLRFRKMLPF